MFKRRRVKRVCDLMKRMENVDKRETIKNWEGKEKRREKLNKTEWESNGKVGKVKKKIKAKGGRVM